MPFVTRNESGTVVTSYANPQPGFAEEWVEDDDPQVQALAEGWTQEALKILAMELADDPSGLGYTGSPTEIEAKLNAPHPQPAPPAVIVGRLLRLLQDKGVLSPPEIAALTKSDDAKSSRATQLGLPRVTNAVIQSIRG